jgi:hypothetical protein
MRSQFETTAKIDTTAEPRKAAPPVYAIVAQNTATVPVYDRGPRIIIVPQAFERDRVNSRASVDTYIYDDDDDVAPPRRYTVAPAVRATPRWAPRAEPERVERPYVAPLPRRVETPAKLRTETRTVRHIDMSKPNAEPPPQPVPQPPSPRRAVLSAPPMPAEGPTPIRPTPSFDSKMDSKLGAKAEADVSTAAVPAEGDETPPPAEITADSPPPGYTPPAKHPN